MDEETQDEKPSVSILSRHRSPAFSNDEVQTLINIVERHKYTILNRSTNSAVNLAKELCWEKIAKIFNSKGFTHERSADSLKTKLENLKKEARKLSKNLVDVNNSNYNDLTRQIVVMMCDVENNAPAEPSQSPDDNDEFNEPILSDEKLSQNKKKKYISENLEENYSDESNDGDNKKRKNSSLNFTPEECSLLLECVRNEKNYVFSKDYKTHAIGLKYKAWKKVTEAFNKRNPQKRSQNVLQRKFVNMKRLAKDMGIKDVVKLAKNFDHNNIQHVMKQLAGGSSKDIKSNEDHRHKFDSNHFAPDSLSAMITVLNSDSGVGSTHTSSWSEENKDLVKTKLELLNYKMETARSERQRIEEASRAEAAAREADVLASALRLRAARLEAVAAAERLPQTHPALMFTTEEQPAKRYLRQYELEHT